MQESQKQTGFNFTCKIKIYDNASLRKMNFAHRGFFYLFTLTFHEEKRDKLSFEN